MAVIGFWMGHTVSSIPDFVSPVMKRLGAFAQIKTRIETC